MNRNKPVLPGCGLIKRTEGIQKLAYSTLLEYQFNLDFIAHLKERLQSMFIHDHLDWNKISLDYNLAAVKNLVQIMS